MSGERIKAMSWSPKISLREEIADAYRAFLAD